MHNNRKPKPSLLRAGRDRRFDRFFSSLTVYEQIEDALIGMPHRVLNHLVENMPRRYTAVIKNQATVLIIDALVSASRREFAP